MSDESPTLRSLFAVDQQVARRCIFDAVDHTVWDGVRIPRIFREAAAEKVAGTLETLLAVPLGDMVAGAFNGYRGLSKYADGGDHEVDKFEFAVESEHTPYVELQVTGFPAQRVTFPVTLSLNFSGVTLVIRNSHLTALKAGTCSATGKLCCEKLELFVRPTTPVRIPGEIPLGDGVRILGGDKG
jgi:hypothetical protein